MLENNQSIFWSFPEYNKYDKKFSWYFSMITLGLLFIIYAIWTKNFLFAIIIILIAVILFLNDKQEPIDIEIELNKNGVRLGSKFYSYKDFDNFWIIYKRDVKNLYFSFKSWAKFDLSIPLEDQNPIRIRKFLLKYLKEDLKKENEPTSEALGRMLKLS